MNVCRADLEPEEFASLLGGKSTGDSLKQRLAHMKNDLEEEKK